MKFHVTDVIIINFQSTCTDYLENDESDTSVTITCSSPRNGYSHTGWSRSPNGNEETAQLLDTSPAKYTVMNGNRLTISNIGSSDEGLYRCVYGETQERNTCIYVHGEFITNLIIWPILIIIFCFLLVLGRAIFASCPLTGLDSSASIPTSLSVEEGGSVGFDATVMHTPGGSCGFRQKITNVQLIKINPEFGVENEQLLFCNINRDSVMCSNSRVSLSRGNDPGYDFVFTLSGASSSDSGMYEVVVGLTVPGTGSDTSMTKMFRLNVTAAPTTSTTITTDAPTTIGSSDTPAEIESTTDSEYHLICSYRHIRYIILVGCKSSWGRA